MAELDGLEPDTEYTVRVWAHVAGIEGAPTAVVVRTGEWALASCPSHLTGTPACWCPDSSAVHRLPAGLLPTPTFPH